MHAKPVLPVLTAAVGLTLSLISPADARSKRVMPRPMVAKEVRSDLGTTNVVPAPGKLSMLSRASKHRPWLTGSGMALTPDDKRLVIADAENNQVIVMDTSSGRHVARVAVGKRPERLVVGSGGLAYVANRLARSVSVVDIAKGKVVATLDGGVEPFDVALSGDQKTLAVNSSATAEILLYDVASRTLKRRVKLASPWPAKVVAHPKRPLLYVTHMRDGGVDVLDTHTGKQVATMAIPSTLSGPHRLVQFRHMRTSSGKRTPVQAFAAAVSPDGNRLYVAHLQVNTGEPQRFGGGGYGLGEPAPLLVGITTFDTVAAKPVDNSVKEFKRDFRMSGAHQNAQFQLQRLFTPSALVHHTRQAGVFMASSGADRVILADTTAASPLDRMVGVYKTGSIPDALAITARGDRMFVRNAGDFSIHSVALVNGSKSARGGPKVKRGAANGPVRAPSQMQIAMPAHAAFRPVATRYFNTYGRDPLPKTARRGRDLFAKMDVKVGGGRFTCVSCHPSGRTDGLTWNIGEGPRQTPILTGKLANTGPFNWNGSEKTLKANVKNTMKRLGGHGLSDADTKALALYIDRYLPGMDNPHKTANPTLVATGRKLFNDPKVGCAGCHDAKATFTDGELHDLGTAGTDELAAVHRATGKQVKGVAFNTPSLQGLWASAPYYHDGASKTLYALLTTGNPKDRMGTTSHLSEADKKALVAYLMTL